VRTALLPLIASLACSSGGAPGPSKQARQELAAFVRAMDHEPDLFWDRYVGHLAPRADLGPSPLVMQQYPVVAITRAGITLDGEAVSTVLMRALLAVGHAENPGRAARVWFAVAPDVEWRWVAAAVSRASDARCTEVLFLFDRPPATPPPPWSAIEGQFNAIRARGAGELASFLADTRRRLLAECPELDAAFVADPGAGDVAGALLERLAAAIETSTCAFDLPAVRSLIWLTAGNPFPHGVVAVPLGAESTLALPADLPWRDASAKIVPGMAAARFVAE
jgi:hypothetical protein